MTQKQLLLWGATVLLLWGGDACVPAKRYQAARSALDAALERESVLYCALEERKTETANLVKQVGDLNRNLGQQDAKIADLTRELGSRTQQLGESSSRLIADKAALELELNAKKTVLARREANLQQIKKVRQTIQDSLERVRTDLSKVYTTRIADGTAALSVEGETVVLSLADSVLFESNGVGIAEKGNALLAPLATFLSERPALDMEVVAHTDNKLPKDKSIKDTWDWSTQRAANVVRLLIREWNVNANQLTALGRGEFYPVASNETPEGRLRNRRTLFVFRPPMPAVPAAE